ncbi:Alpha/beta hydrolase family protein [Corynebacterium capitovis DSM 44611]|uniref:alpha/beta hydrolase family esterase n=1 Tax=Corynebacterium capitovis TaxID=131081 RepID=UPI000368A8C0|nr:hypothetical protein [Corynebacterium capitovis]WKD58133.1 Alpha/beta hydrolase family protein [Corynebacterium capitovis DSM 44611]
MTLTKRSMIHGGRERTWVEVAQGRAETLLLFLHGSQQSATVARHFTARTFDAFAARNCTVVYPNGVGHHFNDLRVGLAESARTLGIDDVGFLTELVSRYDVSRVIGCGFSNGGQMLIRMLFDAPASLHGVALFGASAPAEGNAICGPAAWVPTPVLAVQGTADPIVPYAGGEAGIGGRNRGMTRSALDSAAYFASLNGAPRHETSQARDGVRVDRWTGGAAPVELWSVEGMGHVVPAPNTLDPSLGPGTDKVVGAELVATFFGL